MAKIWRNRIEAGAQKLSRCPSRYREDVIALIRKDIAEGSFTEAQLRALVDGGMMTGDEYDEIMEGIRE